MSFSKWSPVTFIKASTYWVAKLKPHSVNCVPKFPFGFILFLDKHAVAHNTQNGHILLVFFFISFYFTFREVLCPVQTNVRTNERICSKIIQCDGSFYSGRTQFTADMLFVDMNASCVSTPSLRSCVWIHIASQQCHHRHVFKDRSQKKLVTEMWMRGERTCMRQ